MWSAWGDKVAIRKGLRLTRVVRQLRTIFEFQRGEPTAKWVSDFVIRCFVAPRVIQVHDLTEATLKSLHSDAI